MSERQEIVSTEWGHSPILEEQKNQMGLGNFAVARVVAQFKESYRVKNSDGEYLAKITGKQMLEASSKMDYPAVGDFVAIDDLGEKLAVIRGVLPRRSILKRKFGDKDKYGKKNDTQIIATNIDVAFVVESVDRDYSLNRFERYFSLIRNGGARPAIILNKIDLLTPEELENKKQEIRRRFSDVDVIYASALRNDGLDDLKNYITKGQTYCFLGSSGVGKSSLINKLLKDIIIKTGEVSSYSDRGKHTTTTRQMYFLDNGGIVIDNPGMREVSVTESVQEVHSFFDKVLSLSQGCKYADCTHTHEDGCAVIHAVKSGELGEEKYVNYLKLKNEAEYNEMSNYEKREKDRQFGKVIKKAKRDLKDLRHKY